MIEVELAMVMKQVDKSHYDFSGYMTKERWASIWHQLDEVHKLFPESVLEVGPGSGLFKAFASQYGLNVETLDVDPELNPDHVSSALQLPFVDGSFDVVCAFQMLEHLPYDLSLDAFNEMVRVSKSHIVISLPDARRVWRYSFELPRLGLQEFLLPRPFFRRPVHEFDGEHYWEINKKGYALPKIVSDFSKNARLVKTYCVHTNPYHRFFLFSK
jgi:SAM-dependent methyltransferase